jgi:hypothetical protein
MFTHELSAPTRTWLGYQPRKRALAAVVEHARVDESWGDQPGIFLLNIQLQHIATQFHSTNRLGFKPKSRLLGTENCGPPVWDENNNDTKIGSNDTFWSILWVRLLPDVRAIPSPRWLFIVHKPWNGQSTCCIILHHFVLLSMPIAYGVTLNSQTSFHGCCRFRTSAEHLPKLVNSHPPGFAEIISPSLVQEVHQVTMHWRRVCMNTRAKQSDHIHPYSMTCYGRNYGRNYWNSLKLSG